MANVSETVIALKKLNCDSIDQDWEREICNKYFIEFVLPMPLELEEDLQAKQWHKETLLHCLKMLKPWSRGLHGPADEEFWTVLRESDLSIDKVLVLIFTILEFGSKRNASLTQREAAASAANLYFHLLMIPGSGAFNIIHPMLYQKCIDILKLWISQKDSDHERKSSGRPRKPSRGKKRPSKNDDEDDEEDDAEMSYAETIKLHKALLVLLLDTVEMLRTVSLSYESTDYTVQVLVELTRHHASPHIPNMTRTETSRNAEPLQLLYMGLKYLCSSEKQDVNKNMTAVFKNLLPSLLMLINGKGVAAQTIPQATMQIKNAAVEFVCYVVKTGVGDVLTMARTLIQHLSTRVPDKTEYRTKVSQTMLAILGSFPVAEYARMIEWILRLGRNIKTVHRSFVVDFVCLLLAQEERVCADTVAAEFSSFLSHKVLIQHLLSRCSDVSPTIQAHAIAGFSQCVGSSNGQVANLIKDMMTPCVAGRGPVTRLIPTPAVDRGHAVVTDDPQNPASCMTEKTMDTIEQQSSVSIATRTMEVETGQTPAPGHHATARAGVTIANTPALDHQQTPGNTPLASINITPGADITLPDAAGVMSMFKRRACDDKVFVRKAALQALAQVVKVSGSDLCQEDLDILRIRCNDVALTVRKQAMISLTELLLHMPEHKPIQWSWLDGVLRLVVDRETSAEEKCISLLEEVILNNIVPYNKSRSESHKLVWSLLSILASNEGVELRRFLQKVCRHWSLGKKLHPSLITSLQSHVTTENNDAAWLMLAELAPYTIKFCYDFLLDYWSQHARSAAEADSITIQRVLQVMAWASKKMTPPQAQSLIDDLKTLLLQFNSQPGVISQAIHTLSKLCDRVSPDKNEVKKITSGWCKELLTASDRYLSAIILEQHPDSQINEDLVACHLFTVGEVAQLCPQFTPKRTIMLVQSLIATPCITSVDGSSQGNPNLSNASSQSSQPPTQRTGGSQEDDEHNDHNSQLSQGTQSSQGYNVISQFLGSNMSSKIRAHAFLTLGKLCLQNRGLAQSCIAAMARELETSPDVSVRNNVVIIMCDLCIRYTNLVDMYVPNIAMCVKDTSPLIRKQTLTMLTHLLQEDFIKWKDSLFFRFIIVYIDEVKEIAEFAEFCLVHILLQRHPLMFFSHFIECVYHFNAYAKHNVYNKFKQTEREQKMFALKGRKNTEKRLSIYRFMLENMTDKHRFQLTAKLTQEVLGGVVDGITPLDGDIDSVVQDSMLILSSKEIKVSTLQSKSGEDEVVDEMDVAHAVKATAKKALISQAVKRNVIENIVPIVTSLKHILEKARSPLLSDLMFYLRELMKDYKNDIKDILSADRQLATEIEFDLRRFEEEQTESESTPRTDAVTPHTQPAATNTANAVSPAKASPAHNAQGDVNVAAEGTPNKGSVPDIVMQTPSSRPGSSPVPSHAGTPRNRQNVSMIAQAVINSIKSKSATKKAPDPQDGGKPRPSMAQSLHAKFKMTPLDRNNKKFSHRAISTPSGHIGEITFAAVDSNLSAIECSPIHTGNTHRRTHDSQGDESSSNADKENKQNNSSANQSSNLPEKSQKSKRKGSDQDTETFPDDILESMDHTRKTTVSNAGRATKKPSRRKGRK